MLTNALFGESSVLSSVPWWVYAALVFWYLCGVLAMGSMLSLQLWELMPYDHSVRWFWTGALGGGLFLLLASLNGDMGRGFLIPGQRARRRAEEIRGYYKEYGEMLKKDRSLPTRFGLRRWDEIYGRAKFDAPR